LSVASVVCCQVEVSATDWSLVQKSPTDCGASLCVIKKPPKRGGWSPLPGCDNTTTVGCNARKTNNNEQTMHEWRNIAYCFQLHRKLGFQFFILAPDMFPIQTFPLIQNWFEITGLKHALLSLAVSPLSSVCSAVRSRAINGDLYGFSWNRISRFLLEFIDFVYILARYQERISFS
jgi:hypothetical protein